MYTLEEINNKIIWVFREPRSGSTWFSNAIRQATKRNFNLLKTEQKCFYKDRVQQQNDVQSILETHNFYALESLSNYTNPIIIRTARRNKTDQFISGFISSITNIWNVFSKTDIWSISSKFSIDDLPKIEPRNIPLNEVIEFIERKKEQERLWNNYISLYENETVYYEDLLEEWQSKIFPIKFSMRKDEHTYLPKKIPYNKKEIILNYKKIDSMLKDEFGDY